MKITSTKIKDIFIIEPEIYSDNRGYFIESFNQLKFKKSFLILIFVKITNQNLHLVF